MAISRQEFEIFVKWIENIKFKQIRTPRDVKDFKGHDLTCIAYAYNFFEYYLKNTNGEKKDVKM